MVVPAVDSDSAPGRVGPPESDRLGLGLTASVTGGLGPTAATVTVTVTAAAMVPRWPGPDY